MLFCVDILCCHLASPAWIPACCCFQVFVELNELTMDKNQEMQWKETARWIKFEEDVEEETDRWGKPHVASLSFRSLLELRRTISHGMWQASNYGWNCARVSSTFSTECVLNVCVCVYVSTGAVLLDLDQKTLPGIAHQVVEQMIISDQIKAEDRANVLRALLLKHRWPAATDCNKQAVTSSRRDFKWARLTMNYCFRVIFTSSPWMVFFFKTLTIAAYQVL